MYLFSVSSKHQWLTNRTLKHVQLIIRCSQIWTSYHIKTISLNMFYFCHYEGVFINVGGQSILYLTAVSLTYRRGQWHPTPVLLPGKSHGRRSLRPTLAWRIPGMAEPGRLPSMGSHRVGHDWSNLAAAATWFITFKYIDTWNVPPFECLPCILVTQDELGACYQSIRIKSSFCLAHLLTTEIPGVIQKYRVFLKNEAIPENRPFIMLPYDRISWTETDRPETSFVKSYAERSYITKGQENLSRKREQISWGKHYYCYWKDCINEPLIDRRVSFC